ncbi:MAG: hypothetical protein EBS55_11050, partial [Flavobacteriaceae bacterium]|nr:hypothetical protein [Flavobacteriaceae bacterium]
MSCKDGETLIIPGAITDEKNKFKVWTFDQYTNYLLRKKQKGETGEIEKCQSYTEIQWLKKKQMLLGLPDENTWKSQQTQQCLILIYNSWMSLPVGCDQQFGMSRGAYNELVGKGKEGVSDAEYLDVTWSENWWFSPKGYPLYQSWYEQNKKITDFKKWTPIPEIVSPWELVSPEHVIYTSRSAPNVEFDLGKFSLPSDQKTSFSNLNKPLKPEVPSTEHIMGGEFETLAYKDSEIESIKKHNIDQEGYVIDNIGDRVQRPACLRNGETYVNLREDPGVNKDIGQFFDYWDNYAQWTGKKIIGEFTGEEVLLWLPLYVNIHCITSPPYSISRTYIPINGARIVENQSQEAFFSVVDSLANETSHQGIKKWCQTDGTGVGAFLTTLDYEIENVCEMADESWYQSLYYAFNPRININNIESQGPFKVPPPNTVLKNKKLMDAAISTGVAKRWMRVKLFERAKADSPIGLDMNVRYAWITSKYVETCRTNDYYSKNRSDADNEFDNASHGSINSDFKTTYQKTKFILDILDINSNGKIDDSDFDSLGKLLPVAHRNKIIRKINPYIMKTHGQDLEQPGTNLGTIDVLFAGKSRDEILGMVNEMWNDFCDPRFNREQVTCFDNVSPQTSYELE